MDIDERIRLVFGTRVASVDIDDEDALLAWFEERHSGRRRCGETCGGEPDPARRLPRRLADGAASP